MLWELKSSIIYDGFRTAKSIYRASIRGHASECWGHRTLGNSSTIYRLQFTCFQMTKAVINLHWLIGLVNSIGNRGMLNQLEESLSCDSHALGTLIEERIHFAMSSTMCKIWIINILSLTFSQLLQLSHILTGMKEGRIPD